MLATSRVALVEVPRAVSLANPGARARGEANRLLASCMLVDLSDALLRTASELTSRTLRTLDAIHLASALRVGPDGFLVYNRRLGDAGRQRGLAVVHPGLS